MIKRLNVVELECDTKTHCDGTKATFKTEGGSAQGLATGSGWKVHRSEVYRNNEEVSCPRCSGKVLRWT